MSCRSNCMKLWTDTATALCKAACDSAAADVARSVNKSAYETRKEFEETVTETVSSVNGYVVSEWMDGDGFESEDSMGEWVDKAGGAAWGAVADGAYHAQNNTVSNALQTYGDESGLLAWGVSSVGAVGVTGVEVIAGGALNVIGHGAEMVGVEGAEGLMYKDNTNLGERGVYALDDFERDWAAGHYADAIKNLTIDSMQGAGTGIARTSTDVTMGSLRVGYETADFATNLVGLDILPGDNVPFEALYEGTIKTWQADYEGAMDALENLQPEFMRFKEQCFLLSHLGSLHRMGRSRGKTYNDIKLFESPSGQPGLAINKLSYNPAYDSMYDIPPHRLSYLMPSIRLFKVVKAKYAAQTAISYLGDEGEDMPSSDNCELEMEIPFYSMSGKDPSRERNSIDEMFSGDFARGSGAGLVSFDMEFNGSNPVTARTDIKCTVKLFFQTFDEIIAERKVTVPGVGTFAMNYAELAMRSGKTTLEGGERISNPHYYRMKAIVGYQWPDGQYTNEQSTLGFTEAEVEAVENSYMALYLTIIDHEFDIQDDGSVMFTIKYTGYMENVFGSNKADVLLTKHLIEQRLQRKEMLKTATEEGNCSKEQVSDLKAAVAKVEKMEKQQAYQSLLERLIDKEEIYKLRIPEGTMREFNSVGPWAADIEMVGPDGDTLMRQGEDVLESLRKDLGRSFYDEDEDLTEALDNITTKIDTEKSTVEVINYFFLGDLIQVGCDAIKETADYDEDYPTVSKEEFAKSYIVFGPMVLKDQVTGDFFSCNIADIPVSVNYYVEWFMRRVLSKEKAKYPLMQFLRDAISDLCLKFMNDAEGCFGDGTIKQQVTLNSAYLCGKARDGKDPIKFFQNSQGTSRLDLDQITADTSQLPILKMNIERTATCEDDYYNYAIMSVTHALTTNLNGDKEADRVRGIPHFAIGGDAGMIKTIKFKKTEVQGLKEARMAAEGVDNMAQLKEAYNVEVEMFGNSRLFPGMMIYVDPTTVAPTLGKPYDESSKAALLGLGGYHQIGKVTTNLASGIYNSKVTARWTQRGGDFEPEKSQDYDPTGNFCPSSVTTFIEDVESLDRGVAGDINDWAWDSGAAGYIPFAGAAAWGIRMSGVGAPESEDQRELIPEVSR